ncbi:MAG: nitroreductase family protein [Candidatus Methanomethylophilaceae archaeon]|nr:nitroreductase family protein [Candidatus Methanomethylophilaceae archaeon]
MDFLELVKNRYSERYFDSRPIEKEKLDRILEAGRLAPTACNYQPQRFYVMKSEEGLKKADSVTRYRFGAPVIILVCYDANVVWCRQDSGFDGPYNSGDQDVSIAATSMMFEAEEQGIHSLWIRGFDSGDVSEVLELPETFIPVMMLALGYPKDKSKPSDWHFKRMPLKDFVTEV